MSSQSELSSGLSRVEMVLEIDGLSVVWHEHTPPTVAGGHLAPMMDAHVGLIRGVTYSHSLDAIGGVAELGTYAVTLMDTGAIRDGVDNRASMLLRHGPDGADLVYTLAETLPSDIGWSGTIRVHEDLTALPAAGVVHIGLEAIAYTGIIAPDRLTVPVGGRGYLGTQVRRHISDSAKGRAPRVYSDVATWRGRGARLKILSWRQDGSLAPGHVVIVDGVLTEAPTPQPDGTIALTITPWLGRLDAELGESDAQTHLQHGWHIADEHGMRLDGEVSIFWPVGHAYDQMTDGTEFLPDLSLFLIPTRGHQDVYDLTQPSPRDGAVIVGTDAETSAVTGYIGSADGGTLTVDRAHSAAAGDRVRVRSAPAAQRYTYEVAAPGIIHAIEWPGVLEDVSDAWQPATNKGVSGLWADVAILAHDEQAGGPALSVRVNSDHHEAPPVLTLAVIDPDSIWYPLDLADPTSEAYPQIVGDRAGWGLWEPREIALSSRRSKPGSDRDVVPIRGIARAWYQGGETRILVEDDIFTPPPFVARAEWTGRDGDDHTHSMVITAISLADHIFPGIDGYILTVDTESSGAPYSFGDWPDSDRVTIREQVYWDRQTPQNVILQLLTSIAGNGDNGPWDVLPWGVGIPIDLLDIESFQIFPVGGVIGSEWSMDATHGTTAKEVIDVILQVIRAAIVPRLDSTGDLKIALVSVGAAVWTDAIASYDDSVWVVGRSPWSDTDRKIVNSLEISTNFGGDDKPAATTTIIDSDSVGEHGGELSTMSIEARGIRLPLGTTDRVAALLPMATSILSDLSYERLVVHLTVPWSRSIGLHVGAVILVTSIDPPTCRDYRGDTGNVRSQAMRVVRIDGDPGAHSASVDAIWTPGHYTGWAPSLDVAAIVDAVTLTVAAHAHTAPIHPSTGAPQSDVDYYAVGDVVSVIPDGDFAGRTAGLSITAIAGTTITLSGAHGLITADASIDPDPYVTQSPSHRQYAALAGMTPDAASYQYV